MRSEFIKLVNQPEMSMADRAAQFSPFAALTGHDAAIAEAARLTDERPILAESADHEYLSLCHRSARSDPPGASRPPS